MLLCKETVHCEEKNVKKQALTYAMNEWGFIDQDTYVGIGISATSNKFETRRGYERDERLVLFNPHSS